MADELQHFLEITDKWSKRRFALRLDSAEQFASIGKVVDYLHDLTDDNISQLVDSGKLGQRGVQGIEDIRTALFDIKDDGNLGEYLEPVKLKQKGKALSFKDGLKFEHVTTEKKGYSDVYVSRLTLDRDELPFIRNWNGFNKRRWNPNFQEFTESIVKSAYGDKANEVLKLENSDAKFDFIKAVAEAVWNSPYEIYSRFIGRNLKFKNGPDTLEAIMDGKGGNCSEKAAALEFIAYNYGIKGQIVCSGDDAKNDFPYFDLRRALDDFDFNFKSKVQNYWSHNANSFDIDGVPLLVDSTGGPLPFIFAKGEEAEQYFSQKKSSPATFISRNENYFYHKPQRDVVYDMLFTLEAFIQHIDLHHVFGPDGEDTPFGFLITKDMWICPDVYKTAEEFNSQRQQWQQWGEESPMIKNIEIYTNLDSGSDKAMLSNLEKQNPRLVADLRTADEGFVARCREEWKDKDWNSAYIFVKYERGN